MHTLHGQTGENPDLVPRRAGNLPKLVGIVNDNRDIEISDRTPQPGRYKIVVRDSTRSHNWHLYGNGKSISTTVRGTGRWVFRDPPDRSAATGWSATRTTTTWSSTSSSAGTARPRQGVCDSMR